MASFYCEENDILVHAPSLKAAQEYAQYRLSPAYGFQPGRADNLKLKKINSACADNLDGCSITWSIE